MEDEIVDKIAQYDLDQDFPPYANEHKKSLSQIVRDKVRILAQFGFEIEDHQERLKILVEHLKSVESFSPSELLLSIFLALSRRLHWK